MKHMIWAIFFLFSTYSCNKGENTKEDELGNVTVELMGETGTSEAMVNSLIFDEAENLNSWKTNSRIPDFFINSIYERNNLFFYAFEDTFSLRGAILSRVYNEKLLETVVKSQDSTFDLIDSLLEDRMPNKYISIRELSRIRLNQIRTLRNGF